jgi:hypothetical protein
VIRIAGINRPLEVPLERGEIFRGDRLLERLQNFSRNWRRSASYLGRVKAQRSRSFRTSFT